jgi:hypothetical protein
MTVLLQNLPAGAEFRIPGESGSPSYRITLAAAEHTHGWVEAHNLSMTDAEAERRQAQSPGGNDPRLPVFALPTWVEVLG